MADPRATAEKLSNDLHTMFGEELWSVVLFGSVPRGEAVPGISDLNILVLLETIGTRELAGVAPLVQQWIRNGNSPPHFYSWDEWLGMQDTFAIEIADMQDARDVLHGTDPISKEGVRLNDLRLHAERETRETLLNLRLRMMLTTGSPAELGGLLASGLPSFTAYMRAALRLSGEEPGLESPSVIERMGVRIGRDPEPLLKCWHARDDRRPLELRLSDPLVEGYTDFVQGLMQYLDGMPVPAPAIATSGH